MEVIFIVISQTEDKQGWELQGVFRWLDLITWLDIKPN